MASEVIPYLIGAAVVFVLARWLLNRTDNRPAASPSLYFGYSPDMSTVEELARMFPHIPRPYLVRELDRAEGSVPRAVEALLLISADFSLPQAAPRSDRSTPDLEDKQGGPVSLHQHLLKELNREDAFHASRAEDIGTRTLQLDRKSWETLPSAQRQQVLTDRKKAMLFKARQTFRESQEQS